MNAQLPPMHTSSSNASHPRGYATFVARVNVTAAAHQLWSMWRSCDRIDAFTEAFFVLRRASYERAEKYRTYNAMLKGIARTARYRAAHRALRPATIARLQHIEATALKHLHMSAEEPSALLAPYGIPSERRQLVERW